MKNIVLMLLLAAAGTALACEEPEKPHSSKFSNENMEEIVVIGYRWELPEQEPTGTLMMGLSGEVLIHEYDKARNLWVFVESSDKGRKGVVNE